MPFAGVPASAGDHDRAAGSGQPDRMSKGLGSLGRHIDDHVSERSRSRRAAL